MSTFWRFLCFALIILAFPDPSTAQSETSDERLTHQFHFNLKPIYHMMVKMPWLHEFQYKRIRSRSAVRFGVYFQSEKDVSSTSIDEQCSYYSTLVYTGGRPYWLTEREEEKQIFVSMGVERRVPLGSDSTLVFFVGIDANAGFRAYNASLYHCDEVVAWSVSYSKLRANEKSTYLLLGSRQQVGLELQVSNRVALSMALGLVVMYAPQISSNRPAGSSTHYRNRIEVQFDPIQNFSLAFRLQ